jgi:hypothetical protein
MEQDHPPLLKAIRYYMVSVAAVLFVAAAAKLISSTGSDKLLVVRDPVLAIRFRYLFIAAGSLEMIIALVCLVMHDILLQAGLIRWLSTLLILYRIGFSMLGPREICGCLGTLTDRIGVPPQMADLAMKVVLAYLFVGSWGIFLLSRYKGDRRHIENETN